MKENRTKLIAAARRMYQDDECEIDDNAKFSRAEGNPDAGVWVGAWVWVPDSETENDE